MKFKEVEGVWKILFNGNLISVSELIDAIKEKYPYTGTHFEPLEQNFIDSQTHFTTEKDKSGQVVNSPALIMSWFNIYYDYLQARIYDIETKKFREENDLSLLNGKHVKQIDKHGEVVLKELQEYFK